MKSVESQRGNTQDVLAALEFSVVQIGRRSDSNTAF